MKQVCVYVDDDVADALVRYKVDRGMTKVWVVNEALRVFLGMKDDARIRLDVGEEILGKLRGLCLERKQTINEVVGEILKEGLE